MNMKAGYYHSGGSGGKKPAKTMQEVFGKAPANPANLAKKLSGAPAPPMQKGKK